MPKATFSLKRAAMACTTASIETAPVSAAKPPQQHRIGNRTPGMLERQLGGGNGQQSIVPMRRHEVREAEVIEAASRVDKEVSARGQPAEQIDLMHQCGVLHDERVGRDNGLSGADAVHVDATEGDHWRTGAL